MTETATKTRETMEWWDWIWQQKGRDMQSGPIYRRQLPADMLAITAELVNGRTYYSIHFSHTGLVLAYARSPEAAERARKSLHSALESATGQLLSPALLKEIHGDNEATP